VFGTVANAVVGGVHPDEVGIASATNAAFRQLGAPFGVAIASAIFEHAGGCTTPQAISAGVGPALAVAGVISALGAITALGVRAHQSTTFTMVAPAPAS